MATYSGQLYKLKHHLDSKQQAIYSLDIDHELFELGSAINKNIEITFQNKIQCVSCGKLIKKTYNRGVCFPCVQRLASCDMCIVKPELCHFDKGTCREPEWGKKNCMITHTIYLANTSGAKVGVTRTHQQTTRWLDQGATQAMPFIQVEKRLDAGLIEATLSQHIADKTNWRKMLSGRPENIDLDDVANELIDLIPEDVEHEVLEEEAIEIFYPVVSYPEKVKSVNLDKTNQIKSKLMGIKGQYLILECGVFNVARHTGYFCDIKID